MRDAASATPCAWLPAEEVITPRSRTSCGSLAICTCVLCAYAHEHFSVMDEEQA